MRSRSGGARAEKAAVRWARSELALVHKEEQTEKFEENWVEGSDGRGCAAEESAIASRRKRVGK